MFSYLLIICFICSTTFGCLESCIKLAAIISAGLKGFNTFFNISDDKELKKEQIRETEKFNHPFGEHFTILNMYNRSRNNIIYEEKEGEPSINLKEKKRKEWAYKNNVNYKILEEIDNAVTIFVKNKYGVKLMKTVEPSKT